jgi:uncharacterized membrane protein YbhN (UPF0104 family)
LPLISQSVLEKNARWATALVAIALSAAAAWILYQQFKSVSLQSVYSAVMNQSPIRMGLALALTAVSFAALGSFDVFALRVAAPRIGGWRTAALAGATSHAISNMLGFHAVTATAIRYRVYSLIGLKPSDVARIVSLSAAALALGFATMLAAAFLLGPFIHQPLGQTDWLSVAGGVALFSALGVLFFWLSRSPRTLAIFSFRIALPPARLAMLQMAVGAVESAASIGVLYVLLPTDLAPPFATFSIAMIFAVLLGVASHAPAALGAFDAAIVAIVGGTARADLLAALLLYRLAYYVVPFVFSLIALAAFETSARMSHRKAAVFDN